MGGYILRRLVAVIPVVLLVSVLVFSMQHLLPGDPALALAGEERDPQVLAEIRAKYGLDRPLPVQYARWAALALRGDLGDSIRTRLPVTSLVVEKLPVTAELAILSFLVALAVAVPLGVLAAIRRDTVWDALATTGALSGLSIPNFWLGILLILLVAVRWDLLPASGYVPPGQDLWGNLVRMILPALVLGTGLAAVLMRHVRASLLDVLRLDYVRTARSKGMGEWLVIVRHALPNALIPVVTVSGLELGTLLSGAVLTEQIFNVPGFGKLIVDAVFNRDYPVVQGVVLFTSTAYVAVNLLVDVAYALLNPRIRTAGIGRAQGAGG
ncbi:ABC transporter permease [Limnochorda pilosa]|uniref:Peptide ABC transporter n=1 Tax=Limnochorda pilosa TaxID=1555112 RepID=A0A0K2SH73_LIMPI|nr:ABC transporter permease [Limnochorda pilosa]BAS26387.1 peptide ABC transporter [Limnochorda pilosa]